MARKKRKKKASIFTNMAYDDAFRTMEGECDDILISMVNYCFGEKFSQGASITRLRNEHFIEHKDHSREKRITDSYFRITENGIEKKYHFECESKKYDDSLLVRIVEYDFLVAMDDCRMERGSLRLKFPHSALLLLRGADDTLDEARIIIETPEGSTSYRLSIIKMSDFDIDSIFEKKLYILLPFFLFNYDKELDAINENETRAENLACILREILDRLDRECNAGNLSLFSCNVIIKLIHTVAYKLTNRHKNIQKKVGDVMGGKVVELEFIKNWKASEELGVRKGKEEERVNTERERERAEKAEAKVKELEEKIASMG